MVTTDSGRLNPRASVPGRRHAGPGFMTAGSGRAGWGTTDLQAVQPEARHTATMEAIDFANFDAAVSTQR